MMRRAIARAAALTLVAFVSPAASPAQRPASAPAAAFVLSGALEQGGLIAGTAPPGTIALTLDGRPVPFDAAGRFVIGFDRDAAPTAMLVASFAGTPALLQPLAIRPRAWAISRLPTLPRIPLPDAEFERLRPAELAAIAAARATPTDAAGWRQHPVWPVTGRITTLFGSQRVYANGEAGSPHSGIDIGRPTGTPVNAPADGVVVLAADHPFTLEGNLLMIDHGMGLGSAFLHLSRIDVHVGDHVRQGQPVGLVGMTGRATGPHLHWSLRWGAAKLDPLLAAGVMPPR